MDADFCLICGNFSEDRDDENFIIGINPIIYCSQCHIGVHMKCVGLHEVPEVFVCDKCRYLKKGGDPAHLTCAFCPIRYGYLFSLSYNVNGKIHVAKLHEIPRFAHLFCLLMKKK